MTNRYSTGSAQDRRAADLRQLAADLADEDPDAAALVGALAEYVGDAAGDLSPKAVDEVAAAWLAGAHYAATDVLPPVAYTVAKSRAMRALVDINRGA